MCTLFLGEARKSSDFLEFIVPTEEVHWLVWGGGGVSWLSFRATLIHTQLGVRAPLFAV